MISVKTLVQFEIFAGLKEEFIEKLADISEEITVQKGEWLFNEGDKATSLYLIVKGAVELKLSMDKRRSLYVTLNTLKSNYAFGWSSMLDPYLYRLGAVAASDSQLIKINGEQLCTLLDEYPDEKTTVMHRITEAVGSRIGEISQKAPELSLRSATASALLSVSLVLTVLVIMYAVYEMTAGTGEAASVLGSVLFCMILPVGLFVMAYFISPIPANNLEIPAMSGNKSQNP